MDTALRVTEAARRHAGRAPAASPTDPRARSSRQGTQSVVSVCLLNQLSIDVDLLRVNGSRPQLELVGH